MEEVVEVVEAVFELVTTEVVAVLLKLNELVVNDARDEVELMTEDKIEDELNLEAKLDVDDVGEYEAEAEMEAEVEVGVVEFNK